MTIRVGETDDFATCLELRRIVFMQEQGVTEEEEIDGLDPACQHLLASVDGRPAGTARLFLDGDTAKIGRVCVLSDFRGMGLGAALIEEALKLASGKAAQAKLGAQLHALDFYGRLGFSAYGPVYDDAGIPHRDMVRPL